MRRIVLFVCIASIGLATSTAAPSVERLYAQPRVTRCPAHTALDGRHCPALGQVCEGAAEAEGSYGFHCTCTRGEDRRLVWSCAENEPHGMPPAS